MASPKAASKTKAARPQPAAKATKASPRVKPRKPAAAPRAPKARGKAGTGLGASTKDLLHVGLSALSLPRAESAMAEGFNKIAGSFGLKKLEDVFDQRVAAALERLGFPSAKELARLMEALDATAASPGKARKSRKT